MYSKIRPYKPVPQDLKFAMVITMLLMTSVITPIIVSFIKTQEILKSDYHYNLPALRQHIDSSIPDVFKIHTRRELTLRPYEFLFENEIKRRFFSEDTESSIYSVLTKLDVITVGVNSEGIDFPRPCLKSEPVNITIHGWPLEPLVIWVQCYKQISDTAFIMFGRLGDMVYIYEKALDTTLVAYTGFSDRLVSEGDYPCCYQVSGGGDNCYCKAPELQCLNVDLNETNGGHCRTIPGAWPTPIVADVVNNSSNVTIDELLSNVNIYFSVGTDMSITESGSRGLVHVQAKPKSKFLQASAAGIGFGFCGVQFATDGDNILVMGSMDGSGGTCLPINQTCVSVDLENSMDCSKSLGFSIVPLGRSPSTDFKGVATFEEWGSSPDTLNNVDFGNNPGSSILFGPSEVPGILVEGGRDFDILE